MPPYGNELDDFASAFTRTLGIISQFPTKEEKAQRRAQTRETEARAGELEYQALPEQRERRKRAEEETIRGAEAERRRIEFALSPEQVDLANRQAEAQIDKMLSDVEYQGAQIPVLQEEYKKLAFANTPEQRQLATDHLQATIDGLRSAGRLNDAQADKLIAELPFAADAMRANIAKTWAEASGLGAEAEKIRQGNLLQRMGPLDIGKRLYEERSDTGAGSADQFFENYGVPLPEKPAPERAIPETEAEPEPETTPGPQSQAIPEGEPTIQQAAYTPPSAEGGVGGNVVQAQAGTRRLPLNEQTLTMLQEAGKASGLDVRVTSGAQPSSGKNRTGSHRHDVDVGAADVKLIDPATGKAINISTPEGKARAADFIRAARAAGATGIGAGHGYMGDETIHVGFGNEAVWGAGGKGANAEDWLREAFSGAKPTKASVTSESKGPKVLPTPRGGIKRDQIAMDGREAAREGLKAIYAGLYIGPDTSGGAIPTQQSPQQQQQNQQQMRDVLSGKGAASPEALANAQEAVQRSLPKGEKLTEAERNMATLAYAYKWALMVDGDKEKAQLYASQILQAYRARAAQHMTMAKHLTQTGRLDDAAKMALKAYGFIMDGNEASFTKDDAGNYNLTTKDMATGETINQQILSPDQLVAGIMNWSPVDIDRQLRAAAGQKVPSKDFENYSSGMAQYGSAIEELPFGQEPARPPIPDVSQMNEGEAEEARALYSLGEKRVEDMRKEMAPPKAFTPDEAETVRESITQAVGETFQGGTVPSEVMDRLQTAYSNDPQELATAIYSLQNYNRDKRPEEIVNAMDLILSPPIQAPGDMGPAGPPYTYELDRGRNVAIITPVGSASSIEMPANQFLSLMRRAQIIAGRDITERTGEAVSAKTKAERDARTRAAREAAQGARRNLGPGPASRMGIPFGQWTQPGAIPVTPRR